MPTGQRKEQTLKKDKKLFWRYFLLIIPIVLLDQATKIAVTRNLSPAETIPLIRNILHITLVFNTGSAFGMFKDMTFFFTGLTIVIISFIAYRLFFEKNELVSEIEAFSLYLILSGAIGNLIDRIRLGFVIDFIDLRVWPVFNVADSAITCGAVLLAISIFKSSKITANR